MNDLECNRYINRNSVKKTKIKIPFKYIIWNDIKTSDIKFH